ncbi:UNVERIFIED_ORG: sulfotransferase family protein [Burkholderia sp. CF145]
MISDLFDLGTKAFILRSLDDGKEQAKPIIFLHVAKTAGSSFREELAERFQPSENVFVDFSKVELPIGGEKYSAILSKNLQELNDNRMARCRMVSGHFTYNQIAGKDKLAQGRLVTFIRQPISRLVSFYKYHCSDAHPDNASFKKDYPMFRHFVQAPENINAICRQLTPDNSNNGMDAAEWIKRNYYWVGIQENYVASIKLLFAMTGMRFSPRHSIRVFDSSYSDVDAEDIRLAEQLNGVDLQMYNNLAESFSSRWEEIYHQTDYDRVFRTYLEHRN